VRVTWGKSRRAGSARGVGFVATAALWLLQAHVATTTITPSRDATLAGEFSVFGIGARDSMSVGNVDNGVVRRSSLWLTVGTQTLAGAILHSVTGSAAVIRRGKHAHAIVGRCEVAEPWREGSNRCGLGKA